MILGSKNLLKGKPVIVGGDPLLLVDNLCHFLLKKTNPCISEQKDKTSDCTILTYRWKVYTAVE